MMKVIVPNVEFRGFEKRTGKTGNDYGLIYFETVRGDTYCSHKVMFKDDRLFNSLKEFKRGEIVNLECYLEISNYTTFEVINVYPEEVGVVPQ